MVEDLAPFLASAQFIDSDAPSVIDFAKRQAAGAPDDRNKVLRLYVAIRDGITYDPYVNFADPNNYRASDVLQARRGFCVGKAALLAACARSVGVPARVGYADVKNHLTSPRLLSTMKTDVFRWHSYAELFLSGCWVKATPAFDSALCTRLNLNPLEFDGETDSLLHPFDRAGQRHMEYLNDHGTFYDVPFDTIIGEFRIAYPSLMTGAGLTGDFRSEAVASEVDQ